MQTVKPTRLHRDQRGFTIMELLIAMVILAIISAIVYSTFSSVIASTETTNIAAEQLYTQSFLTRNIQTNVTQTQAGWQPGAMYRPYSDAQNTVTQAMPESMFFFEGIDNDVEDSLTFTTSAPIRGMSGLPGFVKQVTYKIIDGDEVDIPGASPYAGFAAVGPVLQITEIPLMSYGDSLGGDVMSNDVDKLLENAEELGIATPTWHFPIGGMDVKYFDGEEWIEVWDVEQADTLPWAIDFTFVWRPWGQKLTAEIAENPENQFRIVVAIPGGVGIRNPTPAYFRPTNQNVQAGQQGGGGNR